MGIDQQKTIRIFRLALTCILVFLITWYFQVPESAWAMITIWFVMYEYSTVGGVLNKSFLRFVGTALSAIYGMIIVYCCANNPVINMMALVPGLFVFAYFFMGGDRTYIGTIGAVTLTIVLLNYNDIDTAVVRVFNVFIGIIVSVIMICVFYPQYARDKLLALQGDILKQYINLLEYYLDQTHSLVMMQTAYLGFEKKILEDLVLYRRLMDEAIIEIQKKPYFSCHSNEIMQLFRRLFHLFSVFVYHVSNDEIRSDPWVREQVKVMLLNLNNLQRQLLQQETLENIETQPLEASEMSMKSRHATERLFMQMQHQITLLGNEVNQIMLKYWLNLSKGSND